MKTWNEHIEACAQAIVAARAATPNKSPEQVATEYLRANGFVPGSINGPFIRDRAVGLAETMP